MKQLKICDFVKWELDMFREQCNFTEEELTYFNLKAKNKSNVEVAMDMHISEPLEREEFKKFINSLQKVKI